MTRKPRPLGRVFLVGAGPGDPGLITLRGLAALRAADVIVHDRLGVSPALLDMAPQAERIFVGKRAGKYTMTQAQINRVLVSQARSGRTVARLKGGDPFVFGRGGEEAQALSAAGIPFEVVPGVTSAIAGPAAAGIPVTHRDAAASVAIATAHEAPGKAGSRLDWRALAGADTVVLLMGAERLPAAAEALIAAGKKRSTPAAVIGSATLPSQQTVTAPLSRIASVARRAGIEPPAITIVGDVVRLRETIGGWDTRPLSGKRVLVTRTREQASELSGVLRELGADVVEAPAIRVEPPASWKAVDRSASQLRDGRFAWVVFTSANGVRFYFSRLRAARTDARAFGEARVAAVGAGTADALRAHGIEPDLIPPTFTTEAIGKAFPRGQGRVLLARADKTEPGLEDALRAKGWTPERVTVYRLRSVARMAPAVRRAVLAGDIDILTFASGGTVRAFMGLLRGKPHRRVKIAAIGPVTAEAAKRSGLRVDAVAKEHTIPGLAAAAASVSRA